MTTRCTATRHGSNSAYRYGCRCPQARETYRLYKKRRREGRALPGLVPQTGTTRRLQALAAIGWPLDELAHRTGLRRKYVMDLRNGRRADTVLRSTADKIAHLYEELSGTPGPSERERLRAARQGWAPPLLWHDIDIDDPHAAPVADAPVTALRRVDLAEVAFLERQGLTRDEIARQMGISVGAIERAHYRELARTRLAEAPIMRRALEQAFGDEAGAA